MIQIYIPGLCQAVQERRILSFILITVVFRYEAIKATSMYINIRRKIGQKPDNLFIEPPHM